MENVSQGSSGDIKVAGAGVMSRTTNGRNSSVGGKAMRRDLSGAAKASRHSSCNARHPHCVQGAMWPAHCWWRSTQLKVC